MTSAFCPIAPLLPLSAGASTTTLRRPRVIVSSASSYDRLASSSVPTQTPSPSPTPSPRPPPNNRPPEQPPNRSPDYHANVGTVTDTLRADYPCLLTAAPDLDMFRDDIILSDAQGNQLVGKDAYRTVLFLLRAHARLFLTSSAVQIVSMYYHEDTRPSIHVRWRMRAIPRVWASSHSQTAAIIDGISVYYLDNSGRVAQHAFETKIRNGPAVVVRPVFKRVVAVGHVAVETGVHLPRNMQSLKFNKISKSGIKQISEEEGLECSLINHEGSLNDLRTWGSLPLSVQLGLDQYVYRMFGITDTEKDKGDDDENSHSDAGYNLLKYYSLGSVGPVR